ncbi:MAG: Uncharacterised protein [Cyanobium sp. ARS6]|nr:MAG: Uncharacterised protein [Cyanobium sp. ARS6]
MLLEIDHRIGDGPVGIRVTTQNHHLQTVVNSQPEHAANRFKS